MNEEISLWYENLTDKEQSDIRDAYEEDLIEHGYARHTVSETDDGWDEFIEEYHMEISS